MKNTILVSAVVAAITASAVMNLPSLTSLMTPSLKPGSTQAQRIDYTANRGEIIKIPAAYNTTEAKELVVGLPDFSLLVAQVSRSVVSIEVVSNGATRARKGSSGEEENEAEKGDPMEDLFRDFLEKNFGGKRPEGNAPTPVLPQQRSSGAGFIFTDDGFIITNAHVVGGADVITVRTTDRKEYSAKVIGVDKKTDVAVIKIDGKDLAPVRFGNISTVEVGQWVVAVGSPFGLENTVTAGIVSAKSRQLPDETYVPFLQTDVAINPGNSGGPLFNTRGEVIGVNSQIYSRTGGYMGLSFAIPVDVVAKVSQSLMKTGKVTRGRIGVMLQPISKELAASFGLTEQKGALISSVEKGGPGEKAGLKEGDIVQDVDGTIVESSQDLPRIIGNITPGTNATLKIWRNKSEKNVKILLAEMKDIEPAKVAPTAKAEPTSKPDKLGLTLRPLTADEHKKAAVEGGLLVDKSEGLARAAGLRAGDLVMSVSGTNVKTQEEFNNAVNAAGKNIALLVARGGSKLFVPITVEEK